MNRFEAIAKVQNIIDQVGAGFHPDNDISEYIDPEGNDWFKKHEIEALQKDLDDARKVLGNDIYKQDLYKRP